MARQEYEAARKRLLNMERIAKYIAQVSENIAELQNCAASTLREAREAYSSMKEILEKHSSNISHLLPSPDEDFFWFNIAHRNLWGKLLLLEQYNPLGER